MGCLECEYKNTKADLDKAEQKLERIKEVCNRIFEDETSTVGQCMVVNRILPIIEEK